MPKLGYGATLSLAVGFAASCDPAQDERTDEPILGRRLAPRDASVANPSEGGAGGVGAAGAVGRDADLAGSGGGSGASDARVHVDVSLTDALAPRDAAPDVRSIAEGGSQLDGAGGQDAGASPWFLDVTTAAGLAEPHTRSFLCGALGCDPESPHMTGGAAAGDFDGDGRVDLVVTRFDRAPALFVNQGDGSFVDVASQVGATFPLRSNGAGLADIDNDGDLDLYLTVLADTRFYLFVNDGGGQFVEEAVVRGAAIDTPESHYGFSVSFGDFDRDGWSDLHACEWRPANPDGGVVSHARLLRNVGDASPGSFTDVTSTAGVDIAGLSALGVLAFTSSFTDLDDDGWPDLAIAADFGTSRLFWNDGDGTFTDGTVAAGVGTDENGMGSALGDYDGDGRLDWFVTAIFDPADTCASAGCNWGNTGNRLYRNLGGRAFEDRTDASGVRDGAWGWGTTFFDYDNDGDLDLAMTNGVAFPGTGRDDSFARLPLRIWRNDDGVYTEVSADLGIDDTDDGKGMLVFDYDDDGDLDLFVTNNAAAPRLYRNERGNENAWLRVRVVGTDSNRDALGAKVSIRRSLGDPPTIREVRGGSQFLAQNELVSHFGLGSWSNPVAEVRVRWPKSGVETVIADVAPNQTLVVVEP